MKWTEVEWEAMPATISRARRKEEMFAELYGRGGPTMREVIDLKRRFEDGDISPSEVAEITGRWSIAEPVAQSLPPISAPRGGITYFRPEDGS